MGTKLGRVALLLLMVNLGLVLPSFACEYCPTPNPSPPKFKPPIAKPPPPIYPSPPPPPPPPQTPCPPPPQYPKVSPPPPPVYPSPPPPTPKVSPPPPVVYPSHPPPPPKVSPPPPVVYPSPPPPPKLSHPPPVVYPRPSPPPPTTPCPPPPSPKKAKTCPIDTLKLGACVDLLGGLIHIGLGNVEDTCCPLLDNLADLDAALCLCTTIKAKLLNINIFLPIALNVLVDCGKTPPEGFKCP